MDWGTLVTTSLAAVTTVVALSSAVSAASRPARLRRDEAMWRQVLEVQDEQLPAGQRRLVQDLHRHTVAQLTGRHLAPTENPWLTAFPWVLGVALSALLGILAAFVGIHVEEMVEEMTALDWVLLGLLLGGGLFVCCVMILGGAVTVLAFEVTARNALAAQVLKGEYPITVPTGGGTFDRFSEYHRTPRRLLRLKVGAMGTAATMSLAGAAGGLWAVAADGGPHVWVAFGCIVAYAGGVFSLAPLWRDLVERPPELESSAYRERRVSAAKRTDSPDAPAPQQQDQDS